jgi:hypothetical protein
VNGVIRTANDSITCLERANDAASNVVATAGRDGLIRYWDQRSRQKVLEIQSRMFCGSRYTYSMEAYNTRSEQAHLINCLQCKQQLRSCRYRKPRRWPPRVSCLRLVRQPLLQNNN